MALSSQWLDELRTRTSLSGLIGQSIKIQKVGNEYKGCCPFHNEKTPSFYVNDAKGFYHCFGCSAHGDAIRWLTDYRGLPFMDAVKELAAAANMTLPAPDPQAAQREEKRASLHDVMAAAQNWFAAQLDGIGGTAARDYLAQRGLRSETIKRFGFGFAPDDRSALQAALSQFDDAQLIEAGLLISVDGKAPYSRFRGRLMIPIRDTRGRVIAFGGRILGSGEPKYLNSPETPLFDKGRTLFNLDQAQQAARQSGRLIVVEGYLDAIALAQAGIDDVVAPLGTALTEAQIELCWKHADMPLICLDGDSAGRKAAMRAALRALPLLRPAHSLRFVTMPDGQDPDDVLRLGGVAAMQTLIDRPTELIDLLWTNERDALPLVTPEQKAGLKQRLRDHAARIANSDIAQLYADGFRQRLDHFFDRSRQQRARVGPPSPSGGQLPRRGGTGRSYAPQIWGVRPETKSARHIAQATIIMTAVVAGLLRYPECIGPNFENLSALRHGEAEIDGLLQVLLDLHVREEALDHPGLIALLTTSSWYNRSMELLRADILNFSFSRPISPKHRDYEQLRAAARIELDRTITALVRMAGLEDALARANQRARAELNEDNFARQQELRQQLEDQRQWLSDISQRADFG